MEYCISTILDQNEGEKKTSGLLPNCRMRNRLPVILRNLQQMPIKRQAQTVLYPMFPNAKIQLFHNMQVSLRKIAQNNVIMSKITIFVPLLMNRALSVPQQNNLEILKLEILKSTTIKQFNNKQSTI